MKKKPSKLNSNAKDSIPKRNIKGSVNIKHTRIKDIVTKETNNICDKFNFSRTDDSKADVVSKDTPVSCMLSSEDACKAIPKTCTLSTVDKTIYNVVKDSIAGIENQSKTIESKIKRRKKLSKDIMTRFSSSSTILNNITSDNSSEKANVLNRTLEKTSKRKRTTVLDSSSDLDTPRDLDSSSNNTNVQEENKGKLTNCNRDLQNTKKKSPTLVLKKCDSYKQHLFKEDCIVQSECDESQLPTMKSISPSNKIQPEKNSSECNKSGRILSETARMPRRSNKLKKVQSNKKFRYLDNVEKGKRNSAFSLSSIENRMERGQSLSSARDNACDTTVVKLEADQELGVKPLKGRRYERIKNKRILIRTDKECDSDSSSSGSNSLNNESNIKLLNITSKSETCEKPEPKIDVIKPVNGTETSCTVQDLPGRRCKKVSLRATKKASCGRRKLLQTRVASLKVAQIDEKNREDAQLSKSSSELQVDDSSRPIANCTSLKKIVLPPLITITQNISSGSRTVKESHETTSLVSLISSVNIAQQSREDVYDTEATSTMDVLDYSAYTPIKINKLWTERYHFIPSEVVRLSSRDSFLGDAGMVNKDLVAHPETIIHNAIFSKTSSTVCSEDSCVNDFQNRDKSECAARNDGHSLVRNWLDSIGNNDDLESVCSLDTKLEAKSIESNLSDVSAPRERPFKITGLPPCTKRPPTRVKPVGSNPTGSASSAVSSRTKDGEKNNSDVLSLYAESLSNNIRPAEVSKAEPAPPQESRFPENTTEETANQQRPCDVTVIPRVFSSHCYFLCNGQESCEHKSCNKQHDFSESFYNKMSKLPVNRLLEAYEFAVKRPYIYEQIVLYLIRALGVHKLSAKLFIVIGDILQMNCDKTPFIEEVIGVLKNIGWSLSSVVQKIIVSYGVENGCLVDILLYIICKQRNKLCDNWHLVKQLVKCRPLESVDYGLIGDLLAECIANKNKQLCKNIVRDIIYVGTVKLDFIDDEVLQEFHKLLQSLELENEKRKFQEVLRYCNKSLLDFSEISSDSQSYPEIRTTVSSNKSDCHNGCDEEDVESYESNSVLYETSSSSTDTTRCPDFIMFNDEDKFILKEAIPKNDYLQFAKILNKLKAPNCNIKPFVTYFTNFFLSKRHRNQTLTLLKSAIDGCGSSSSYKCGDEEFKKIVQTLVVNVLPSLEVAKMVKEAANLVQNFILNLEDLIQVKFYQRYSEIGRYLYFCKILLRGGYLRDALDILISTKLNLLGPKSDWSLYNETHDVQYRNRIVREFINTALSNDLSTARKIIFQIILNKNFNVELKIWKYFNKLTLNIIDKKNTHIEDLRSILKYVLDGWYQYLTRPVMRGLTIVLIKRCSPADFLRLYQLCTKLNIYPPIKGNDQVLTLTPEMAIEEIMIVIYVFLSYSLRNPYNVNRLTIKIAADPKNVHEQPKVLLNSTAKVKEAKGNICSVLARSFRYTIIAHYNETEPCITIEKNTLQKLFKLYCDTKTDIW